MSASRAVRVPIDTLKKATASLSQADRAEMAIPSYCHPNPLIRWLFWSRLDAAVKLAALQPGENVFEYGVGSGILFPSYHQFGGRIAATDLHLNPSQSMLKTLGIRAELIEVPHFQKWTDANKGQFDCIFALDVLEHVEDDELVSLSGLFRNLLSPKGRLIVSGPTENIAYKIGRFVAGFKNHYHHRNIYDIHECLSKQWKTSEKLYLPRMPLPRAFMLTRYDPRKDI